MDEEEASEWERLIDEKTSVRIFQEEQNQETRPVKAETLGGTAPRKATEDSPKISRKKITQRYALPLLATGTAAAGSYLELEILYKYSFETQTSWSFFLFIGIAQCLLSKANINVNFPAKILAYFCISSSLGIFLVTLFRMPLYHVDNITTAEASLYVFGIVILLLAKPIPLLFLIGNCFCLRNKTLCFLCLPLLISCWLSNWVNGWDYGAFVVSAFGIILICSLVTMLDEKNRQKEPAQNPHRH